MSMRSLLQIEASQFTHIRVLSINLLLVLVTLSTHQDIMGDLCHALLKKNFLCLFQKLSIGATHLRSESRLEPQRGGRDKRVT